MRTRRSFVRTWHTDRLLSLLCCLLLAAVATIACSKRDLRGRAVASPDGRTYLAVEDDNGGACGPILVDGRRWPHPIHVPGEIGPGRHVIECGTKIELEIPAATTFHFDYWGP